MTRLSPSELAKAKALLVSPETKVAEQLGPSGGDSKSIQPTKLPKPVVLITDVAIALAFATRGKIITASVPASQRARSALAPMLFLNILPPCNHRRDNVPIWEDSINRGGQDVISTTLPLPGVRCDGESPITNLPDVSLTIAFGDGD